jgi:hypothetical protein
LKYDKETVLKGFNQWATFITYFPCQKTDFYNCRPVACGHIVCANLSDGPKAVYDDLKSLDLQLYWRGGGTKIDM